MMRMKFLILCIVVVAFLLGGVAGRECSSSWDPIILTSDIDLDVAGAHGRLPKGVVLYRYKEFGETTQYLTFVELKERNVLLPAAIKRGVIAPANATPALGTKVESP